MSETRSPYDKLVSGLSGTAGALTFVVTLAAALTLPFIGAGFLGAIGWAAGAGIAAKLGLAAGFGAVGAAAGVAPMVMFAKGEKKSGNPYYTLERLCIPAAVVANTLEAALHPVKSIRALFNKNAKAAEPVVQALTAPAAQPRTRRRQHLKDSAIPCDPYWVQALAWPRAVRLWRRPD